MNSNDTIKGLFMFLSGCYLISPRVKQHSIRKWCCSLLKLTPRNGSFSSEKEQSKPAALICLPLPQQPNKMLQHLKNDEILSKAIKDTHGRYYVEVQCNNVNDGGYDKSALMDYISSVYDKVWNEFVSKKMLSTEFFVICDSLSLSDGTVSSQQVLTKDASLRDVYSLHSSELIQSINSSRANSSISALQFTSTTDFTASIERGVNETERIHFVEHQDSRTVASNSNNTCGGVSIDMTGGGLPKFDRIAMGGTFDCIHNGHRKLLAYAASMCNDTLTVGITGDVMLASKSNASMIASFEIRKRNLYNFVHTLKPGLKLNIVELSEPFGPTITEDNIQAIIVSSETISGAVKINQVRREKGMQPLSVVVTFRESTATLSSSFIRDFKQRQSTGM